MLCVADAGDEVLVFDPSYTNYCGFAASAGVVLVPITLEAEQGFHPPVGEALEAAFAAAVTSRTRALLICNPNNPTGSVYTTRELTELLALAARHNLFVIADEVYREFVFDRHTHTSMLTLEGAAERVVMVDSVSKRFNACGARIGCLASHHRAFMAAALRLAQARLAAPTIEQLAMIPLLENAQPYTKPLAAAYQRRRDAAVAALGRIPGIRFNTPEGAFYMIVELPVDDAERFARWLLADYSEDSETVMVAPLRGFYVTPGRGTRSVRLAFVLGEADLARAIEILGHALSVYPGKEER
jgi:aspartate aminotransferase